MASSPPLYAYCVGIIFGVASVIAMLAIGEGASRDAMAQMRDSARLISS